MLGEKSDLFLLDVKWSFHILDQFVVSIKLKAYLAQVCQSYLETGIPEKLNLNTHTLHINSLR